MADISRSPKRASTSLSALSVRLNAIGKYILCKAGHKDSPQLLIIKHLSFSDIVVSLGWLTSDALTNYIYPTVAYPKGGNGGGVQPPNFSKIWSSRFVQKRCKLHACVNNDCKMICYLP